MKIQASHIEGGIEFCNTCGRTSDQPYRYRTDKGVFGCVSECHDPFVRHNTRPDWRQPRYVLPKWIIDCRKAIKALHRVA